MTGESPPRSAKATAAPHAPGARRLRLPHPALEDPGADRARAGRAPERHVRAVREARVVLDGRALDREVQRLELGHVGDPDRALRVADRHVLEAAAADLAGAVGVARRVVGRAQGRAAHVDAAGARAEDRRADLPRDRLDRELALVGPAGAAEVEDRLARAVARELGLRAVRVEDPQPGDEAGLVGRRELEHAVAARAGVPVAEPPDALGRERERERVALHDQVVVAERLPLLEPHGVRGSWRGRRARRRPVCGR